jgi:hypothetical protein
VAVDNGDKATAFVGPAYSYYEFASPERLTDEEWRERLRKGRAPARPAWTQDFAGPRAERELR